MRGQNASPYSFHVAKQNNITHFSIGCEIYIHTYINLENKIIYDGVPYSLNIHLQKLVYIILSY